jgi:hypothetical protein
MGPRAHTCLAGRQKSPIRSCSFPHPAMAHPPNTNGHAPKKRTHVDMDDDGDAPDVFAGAVGAHSTPAKRTNKKARLADAAALQAQRRELPIYTGESCDCMLSRLS